MGEGVSKMAKKNFMDGPQLRWFCATRSIEKLILKLTLFLYSALNCGSSSKVSITLGNFLNF